MFRPPARRVSTRLSSISRVIGALIPVLLLACASWGIDPPRVLVVGMDPLPGEGMDVRFALKLRVQNPNDAPIEYDGIAVALDLNGQSFATGVSDVQGSIPRFGETVLTLPISISAWSAVRQVIALMDPERGEGVPYELRGKLGRKGRALRFSHEGLLELPEAWARP